jgi:RimJ/RimL family protein N-acetyltransferase
VHVELDAGAGLRLRPPRPDEAADALVLLADPEVVRWNPAPAVVDEASARAWCERGADWSAGTHATFSVVDAATGRFLGNISLHEIRRDEQTARIGYRVMPDARSRGVASAGVRAVTAWAFDALGLARVALVHAVTNPASCRVAVNAGYALEGVLRAAGVEPDGTRHDEHLHARLAGD